MTNKQLTQAIKNGVVPINKTVQILLDSDRIVGIREGKTVFDLPRPGSKTGTNRIVKQMVDRIGETNMPLGDQYIGSVGPNGIVFRPETRLYTKSGGQRFRIPGDHKTYDKSRSDHQPNLFSSHPIGYYSRKPAKQLNPVQPRPVRAPNGYRPAQVVYNGVSGDPQTGAFTYTGKKPKKGAPILVNGESYTNDWIGETLRSLKGETLRIFVSECGAEPTPADQRFYQTRSYTSETLHPTELYILICCERNNGRYRSVLIPKATYDFNQ